MADAYAQTEYATLALWKAAIAAVTANKLVACGVYKEQGKKVFWLVVAA
jgi:hypothetical protein